MHTYICVFVREVQYWMPIDHWIYFVFPFFPPSQNGGLAGEYRWLLTKHFDHLHIYFWKVDTDSSKKCLRILTIPVMDLWRENSLWIPICSLIVFSFLQYTGWIFGGRISCWCWFVHSVYSYWWCRWWWRYVEMEKGGVGWKEKERERERARKRAREGGRGKETHTQ